jgi:hypothetical protein
LHATETPALTWLHTAFFSIMQRTPNNHFPIILLLNSVQ